MTDPRGKILLKAGTKKFPLRLPINAICDMEADFSAERDVEMDCIQIGMKLEGANFRAIRKVIFHALATDWKALSDGELTLERAGEIMEASGLKDAAKAVGDLWRVTFPQPEKTAGQGDAADAGEADQGDQGNAAAK